MSAIARYLATTGEVLGALVVGSMAAGTANAASDVDLIVCAHPGRFEEAWQIRKHMHVTGALASWDDKGDGGAEIGVHRWVTSDVILIEALFATPGSGVRLGRPWMAIAGKRRVAACFPPRPRDTPIDRSEFDPQEMAYRVDRALDMQKTALRCYAKQAKRQAGAPSALSAVRRVSAQTADRAASGTGSGAQNIFV